MGRGWESQDVVEHTEKQRFSSRLYHLAELTTYCDGDISERHGKADPDRRRQRDDPESFRHDVLGSEDFTVTTARSAGRGPDAGAPDAARPRDRRRVDAGPLGLRVVRGAQGRRRGCGSSPVYILSSTHQPYDEAKGQQVGADGTLVKPWDSTIMIEKLKEASARPAGAARPAAPAAPPPRPTRLDPRGRARQ